jgi:flagellar secretion chaperone FliS
MTGNMNTQYIESRILTASQPRLHLMLLEGALRQCAIAKQAAGQEFWGEFDAALGKTMDIVEELVRSVSGKPTDISASLEEQYAFLFRELAAARVEMDSARLASCVKLLEFQRETWKQACEKSDSAPPSRSPVVASHLGSGAGTPVESFSFEA